MIGRNTIFILLALFIDGIQAAISWGIAMIAAFPGTALGAGGGAVVGAYACSWLGFSGSVSGWCAAAAGFTLGLIGTPLDVAAPVTIPIGIAVGFAVTMTLSLVLGWGFLVPLMFFNGLQPQKNLWWAGGDMIPGINNVPFWTLFTFRCLWTSAAGAKQRKGVLGLAAAALPGAQGVMTMKENTMNLPGVSQTLSAVGLQQERASQPGSARELVRMAAPLQDIRPAPKPNVQTA